MPWGAVRVADAEHDASGASLVADEQPACIVGSLLVEPHGYLAVDTRCLGAHQPREAVDGVHAPGEEHAATLVSVEMPASAIRFVPALPHGAEPGDGNADFPALQDLLRGPV